MENDSELKGDGNSYDFGARMLDPRIGRWFSQDEIIKPNLTPYHYVSDNPITFVDPDGNTDFYFNGQWVGTDGIDNNQIAVVRNKGIKNKIAKNSRKGLVYLIENTTNGFSDANFFIVNKDILNSADGILDLQLSDEGKTREFGITLNSDGENGFTKDGEIRKGPVGDLTKGEAFGVDLPDGADVTIHGHPTGAELLESDKRKVIQVKAEKKSPTVIVDGVQMGDTSLFQGSPMNIIVGKNGSAKSVVDKGNKVMGNNGRVIEDFRDTFINFFDNNISPTAKPVFQISGKEAKKILDEDPEGANAKAKAKFNEKKGG